MIRAQVNATSADNNRKSFDQSDALKGGNDGLEGINMDWNHIAYSTPGEPKIQESRR
jgi:hypothetical protein